ncbi:MAG: transcriptional repressor [Malacoplasma sp.]|nr:transcriptional repressor [Malacoplasma sp.]MDE5842035.1 transcriptional repressor [Malacoplasma sp.]MDE6429508.1 transcriptional repressor [Malacoplasma sp.]MDE6563104.1 transcriptional repressor [Malacoplasma sp.]
MSKKLIDKLNSKTDKNFRITKIRVDIIDCLNDDYHGHTIKNIIDHLNTKGKKVNVSSVYNTINFLIDEGIVEIRTDFDTKEQSFELIDKDNLHIHLHDLTNNKIKKISLPNNIKDVISDFLKKEGYQYENIKLDITATKSGKKMP